jgi:hypothetical protein
LPGFLSSLRDLAILRVITHGLRRALDCFAASRLFVGRFRFLSSPVVSGQECLPYAASRLLWDGQAASVDFFKDGVTAALQERFADFASQLLRLISVAGLPQDL